MRRYSRRQFLSTAAIAGAASLLAACAQAAPTKAPVEQGPTPVVATEVPKEQPTVAPPPSGPVEVSLPYLTFDSFDHAYWTSQLLLAQGTIFEGLFGYDDKLNIIPKICESYTVSDDYKVFTYKLRTDKKWANGDPVTARDFYNAWMRFMSNELQDTPMWAGAWSYIQNAWAYKSGACGPDEVGVKLIGDDVIEVTLNQPFPSFSNALVMAQAMPIHSKTLEEHPTDWWRPEYKAFNGPFIVDEWVAGGETRLVRNPNYVGERYGNVDVIYLKPFSDPNALIQAFENGELQYAGLGDASQVAYVKNHPTLKDGYRNWDGSTDTPGNFYPIRFGGLSGADAYLDHIRYGSPVDYQIGDRLETEPGKMTGPTSRGVAYLISQAQQQPWANQTWQTASMDNPRVVILPVVDWDEAGSGQTQVTIKSFAIFYLEGIRNRSVTGFFLRYFNLENGEYDSGVPDPTTDGGVRTVRLIE